MKTESRGGIYIHVPYCKGKCLYCDFFSGGARIAEWDRFVDAILNELTIRREEIPENVDTIYIGGGTPSLIPPGQFTRLASSLFRILRDEGRLCGVVPLEFTLEANPEDVSVEMLECWRKSGVDRLSVGVQSFSDRLLRSVRRGHSSRQALEAIKIGKAYFPNISLDLIYGLPGQTFADWEKDLRVAVSLDPAHISLYSLMYEEGTAMTLLRDRGEIMETDEDVSLEMYRKAVRLLGEAGLEQYEISNYARPAHESLHNSGYWSGMPYLGLGPAASSYDGYRGRATNLTRIKEYLDRYGNGIANGYSPARETLSDEELAEEYILTRLRRKEGFLVEDYRSRFGKERTEVTTGRIYTLERRGLLDVVKAGDELLSVALSRDGIMLLDEVVLELSL